MAVGPYSIRAGSHAPGPVPSTGNPELERYLAQELGTLFFQIQSGASQIITLEVLGREPPNVFDGLLCFFRESVVAPQRGFYGYENGNWKKL